MGVPDQTSWFRSIKANIRSIKANDQMGVPDQTCWFKSIKETDQMRIPDQRKIQID